MHHIPHKLVSKGTNMAHQDGIPTWWVDGGPTLTDEQREELDEAIQAAHAFWKRNADVLDAMITRGRELIAAGNLEDIRAMHNVLVGLSQALRDMLPANLPADTSSKN